MLQLAPTMRSVQYNAAARVLLVEDDAEIASLSAEVLQENGLIVYVANSAAEMDAMLSRERVDLVVLDIMLPDEDGFSICRRLRATSTIPIVMLTGRREETDRIVGLELGADDYIVKPFNSRELIARIRALLRRVRFGHALARVRARALCFAGWRLEPIARELQDPNGAKVPMTSVEIDLLIAFCRHAGHVLSREQLLALIHGRLAASIERSIDVHVSRIRQKIEPDPRDPTFIKTVRLGGYIFTPFVEET